MATSYNRRINLYINGQQVTNDIASIRAEMNLALLIALDFPLNGMVYLFTKELAVVINRMEKD